MTDTDDDVDEYLDPDLDPTPSDSDGWFPSLFSVGGLVVGLHFLAAGAILPAGWSALQNGAHMRAGFYSMLAALMIVAGIVIGRIANERRE